VAQAEKKKVRSASGLAVLVSWVLGPAVLACQVFPSLQLLHKGRRYSAY
jgi:hypothetical protein